MPPELGLQNTFHPYLAGQPKLVLTSGMCAKGHVQVLGESRTDFRSGFSLVEAELRLRMTLPACQNPGPAILLRNHSLDSQPP